jgi:GT2 family glycosyltransferase
MAAPVASIIIYTFNQADWLERCLWAYAQQDRLEFELVIADDGSDEGTTRRIDRLRPELPYVAKHVWQADRGGRRSRILNRAILLAVSDYLIFSQGDCVPRPGFVAQHLQLREAGRFLGGGYAEGAPRWVGSNASAWKDDVLRVNGFDERLGQGDEDLEMSERLHNAGVRGKQIRYSALAVHHPPERDYVDEVGRAATRRIRERTRAERRSWTDHGIVSLRLD